MTVRELALSAAEILQADDIQSILGSDDGDVTDPDVRALVKCVDLAVRELAVDMPLIEKSAVRAENGVIPFAAFGAAPSTVRGVYRNGRAVRFKLVADGIYVGGDGEYKAEYTVAPPESTVDAEIKLGLGADADILCYLAARNYCLVTGRADEATVWDQRYNAETEKRRIMRRASLPKRAWA